MALFKSDEELVKKAEGVAGKLKGVKTHQLRRIYSQVQSIYQLQNPDLAKSRLILLKPQLAYAASRSLSKGFKEWMSDLNGLIDKVGDSPENLEKFYQYVQSVVAYHKE